MYKNDVVRKVAQETRLSQRAVGDALNSAVKVITQALKDGRTVTFPGFGTFYTSQRREGTVRHIRTKEAIKVPARRVAGFRAGEQLKQSVRTGVRDKPGRRGPLGFIRKGK